MPLASRKNCVSCQTIKAENAHDPDRSRLYKLIDLYHLKGTTMTAINQAYPDISYLALRNHAKKHQHPSEKQRVKNAEKETVIQRRSDELTLYRHHNEARKELIAKAMQGIETGDIKLTAAALVNLLKQEADIEEKSKDRGLEVMKMMSKFQSGEIASKEALYGPDYTQTPTERP